MSSSANNLKLSSPFDYFQTMQQLFFLGLETQSVITLRVLGMSGLWAVAPSENDRMIAEKGPAFAKSATAAMTAVLQGKPPEQVIDAAVKPLRHKTRSNVRRLAKRGPKMLG